MIKLTPMGGMIPRMGNRLLPDTAAQSATNVKLQSGELRPLRSPGLIYTPAAPKTNPALSIFKARNGSASSEWFSWPIDVDCVRVPLATDVESRFCWTGDGVPKTAKYSNAVSGGGNNYPLLANELTLGIPTPTTAVSVSHSGGTGSPATRWYRYAFVSQDGEESGPSPISAEVTGKTDGTWNIGGVTAMQAFPLNNGTGASAGNTFTASATHWLRVGDAVTVNSIARTVTAVNGLTFTFSGATYTNGATTWARVTPWNTSGMYRRLYRTTGSTGAWQMVADYLSTDPLYAGWTSATTFSDTYSDAQIAGDELLTEGWEPPPVGLTGLCLHPSGSLCGFVNNIFCASEPLQPHAWPTAYQLSSGYNGVGMAVFGTTVVMATAGQPFVVTGVEPASMTGEDVQGMYPCLSKRSVISVGDGVLYSSKHGAVSVGTRGASIFTDQFYTRDEWELLNPETMIFETANGRLYIAYTQDDNTVVMLIIDGPLLVSASVQAKELYADVSTGDLYIATSTGISLWDSSTQVVMQGNWRSKEFVFPAPINIGAGKVEFDLAIDQEAGAALTAAIAAINAANLALMTPTPLLSADIDLIGGGYGDDEYGEQYINGSNIGIPPENPPSNIVTVTLFNGSTVLASRQITSELAFRLPAGYKKDHFSVQVTSQCTVKEIRLAETMNELRSA